MISDVPGYARAGHRAAVLGRPVAHSLSPVLHRAAYEALGLADWRYDALEVEEQSLREFLDACGPGWAGWSLTMPLKRAVRPLLVRESDLARDVGAVNTVLVAPDGLEGFNTDVHGIVEAFGECGITGSGPDGARVPREATILGGGATASSALAAVAELGCDEPVVHVRSVARAGDLLEAAERLGLRPRLQGFDVEEMTRSISRADLVVSTLPGGVADDLVAGGVARAARDRRPVLLDVVYDPWPTKLADAWSAEGATAVGGFVMLVHQAYGQVHLMTGQRPPVEEMRAAGEAELLSRQRAAGLAAVASRPV